MVVRYEMLNFLIPIKLPVINNQNYKRVYIKPPIYYKTQNKNKFSIKLLHKRIWKHGVLLCTKLHGKKHVSFQRDYTSHVNKIYNNNSNFYFWVDYSFRLNLHPEEDLAVYAYDGAVYTSVHDPHTLKNPLADSMALKTGYSHRLYVTMVRKWIYS